MAVVHNMSEHKKLIRAKFRNDSFKRDHYTCKCCGLKGTEETLDCHHVSPRISMPHGGYVKENGITLCKIGNPSCHEKAEAYLNGEIIEGFSPEELYRKIGSSYELAVKASQRLK